MKYRYLTDYQAEVVHAWYRGLRQIEDHSALAAAGETPESDVQVRPFWYDRGHRARLRRAALPEELAGESACYELRERLGTLRNAWLDEHDAAWLFLLAGAVAHVDDDTYQDRGLALALGRSAAMNDASPMSEMRFRRLLKEENPAIFYRQLQRALQLASGRVNVAHLANDLLAWCAERGRPQQTPDAVHYRWARDYYLDRKDLKLLGQNSSARTIAKTSQETTA